MPSSEDILSVHVTRAYQNQILQCQKLVNGTNGLQSRIDFESNGESQPQQRVDIMGDDGLLRDSITYFDKPPDFDSARVQNCEPAVVDDKGADVRMDLRNRIARQWRCPALALKTLESMPVRNLFRVTQSAMEHKPAQVDVGESFVKSGDAFLSAVDDGSMSEKKLVTIMLAFQRWRQSQLKNILGQELVKVLEEAREDEIARASLESQLEHTEQLLATERAKSAMLHSQLATAVNSTHFHENGYTANNATVSKIDRQVMTMEDFKAAETEIEVRDNQIHQLKERIRSLEDKIGRGDGQLNRLHLEKSGLQAENSIVLRENRALLEQLSSRDKEVAKQVEEMEMLKALATRLKELQNSKQDRIDSMVAEVKILQEQLQQAHRANSCKEVELATSVEHCSHLKHEKGTLLMQLQEAEKRADLASTRAEELCAKLQCKADGADESAEAASEMVKHLKKLTQNVRDLETTINATDAQATSSHAYHGSRVRNRIENTSGHCLADQVYNTFPQDPEFWENYPICPIGNGQDPRSVSFSSGSDHSELVLPSAARYSVPQYVFQDGIANWITWKWRWAASSARAELLARKLHSFNQNFFEDLHLDHKQQKVQDLLQRLGIGNLTIRMEDENLNTTAVAEPKLAPLILSAWRAFTRTSVLQRKALSRNASLDKMLDALPWWIRRARDRRQLERSFFQWLVFTLSAKRQQVLNPHPGDLMTLNKPRSKAVVEEPASCEDSRTLCKPPYSFSTKLRQVKGPGDEINAVNSQIRRAQRVPGGYANAKPRVGDNRHQLPSGSQTRALQAFQTTLQQEVTELTKIAGQEIQSLQRNSQARNRPVTAPTESSYAKQRQPDGKKVLKSVLGVCNNLALALTNVRGKLSPHVRADSLNRRAKLSPRVLADTVNTCIRNEQTKITKAPARQLIEGQSPRAGPRGGLIPGRPGNSNQAWEGWGTQIAAGQSNSCSRKPVNMNPAPERRTRVSSAPVMEVQEPGSRYQSPFRSQIAPNPKKASHNRTEIQNTTNKDKCNTTYSLAPVQEIGRFKRSNSVRDKRSKPASNPVLNMSVINKVLGDGATNASLEEKKLVGSALARLVSTKISKLRGGQAV